MSSRTLPAAYRFFAVAAALGAANGCGQPLVPPAAAGALTDAAAADATAAGDTALGDDDSATFDVSDPADGDAAAAGEVAADTLANPADSDAADSDAADLAGTGEDGETAAADGTDDDAAPISCTPGEQKCEGVKLATCLGDGYSISSCYPGMACSGGKCQPVGANLIIAFDTSGSMSGDVGVKGGAKNCPSGYDPWPKCEYDAGKFPKGCTRIGVSKIVFKKALAKLDDQITHLALFKFPQTLSSSSTTSCDSGAYNGNDTITGDTGAQTADLSTPWYKNLPKEALAVPYPVTSTFASKVEIGKWMDGTENQNSTPKDPELRADGGTPIGKTLFYIGEYLRNQVIVDGRKCAADADCGSVNYVCESGLCTDPARSCRDTVVVLFTDGGESSSNSYFGPWVQAKRMSIGLGCATDADCAGGATCKSVKQCSKTGSGWTGATGVDDKPCGQDSDCGSGGVCGTFSECTAKADPSGLTYFCSEGGAACDPLTSAHCVSKDANKPCKEDKASNLYCAAYCVRDPRPGITVSATAAANSVLRSPDGKPFGVRLFIVDIGSTSDADIINSWRLAQSGGGRLLGVDAGDPAAFLGVLDKAFDLKNKKICGITE